MFCGRETEQPILNTMQAFPGFFFCYQCHLWTPLIACRKKFNMKTVTSINIIGTVCCDCHCRFKRTLLNTRMIMVWLWYIRTVLAALFTMKARQLIQRVMTYKTWHREVASMLYCETKEGETQFVSASVSSTSQIIIVKVVSVSHQGFFPGRCCTNVTICWYIKYYHNEEQNFLWYLVAGQVGLNLRPNLKTL